MKDFVEINRNAWNIKTDVHLHADFYKQEEFLQGKSSLNSIELELLGDIKGKKVLHLQCHFGQDSISLAKLGAEVTAVDLSDRAIEVAKDLALKMGVDVNFICSNIYDLKEHLQDDYDIVFTSYGVLGWLPDLEKWASLVADFLKPRGKFVIVEFHPVVWMFDDEFKTVVYSYFKDEAIEEEVDGTYADRKAEVHYKTVSWNYSLGEVFSHLLNCGIRIVDFKEYDYSVFPCFANVAEIEKGKYQIKGLEGKLPMMFSLVGEK